MNEARAEIIAQLRFDGTIKTLEALKNELGRRGAGSEVVNLLEAFEIGATALFEGAKALIQASDLGAAQESLYYEKVVSIIIEHTKLLADVMQAYPDLDGVDPIRLKVITQVIDAIASRFEESIIGGANGKFLSILALNFQYVHFTYTRRVGVIGIPPDVFTAPIWSFGILWHEVAGQQVAFLRRNGLLGEMARELQAKLAKQKLDLGYQNILQATAEVAGTVELNRRQTLWLGEFIEDAAGVVAIGPANIEILADVMVQHYPDLYQGDHFHPPPILRLMVAIEVLAKMLAGKARRNSHKDRHGRMMGNSPDVPTRIDQLKDKISRRYDIAWLKLGPVSAQKAEEIQAYRALAEQIADYIYWWDEEHNDVPPYINNKITTTGPDSDEETIARLYAAAISEFFDGSDTVGEDTVDFWDALIKHFAKESNNLIPAADINFDPPEGSITDLLYPIERYQSWEKVPQEGDGGIRIFYPEGISPTAREEVLRITSAIEKLLADARSVWNQSTEASDEENNGDQEQETGEEPKAADDASAGNHSQKMAETREEQDKGVEDSPTRDLLNPAYRVRTIKSSSGKNEAYNAAIIVDDYFDHAMDVREGASGDYYVGVLNEHDRYELEMPNRVASDRIIRFSNIDRIATVHTIVALDVEGKYLAVNDLDALLQVCFAEIDGNTGTQGSSPGTTVSTPQSGTGVS